MVVEVEVVVGMYVGVASSCRDSTEGGAILDF